MAIPRRRHHQSSRVRWLVPVVSAVSASLLFLYLLLSFLAPSPVDNNDRIRRQRHDSLFHNDAEDAIGSPVVFHVPNNGGIGVGAYDRPLWSSRNSQYYHGCCEPSDNYKRADAITRPNRYLLIITSGGLNQQRTGITDAVVAARILNATLVVPKLDKKSYWKDSSNFSEIFDVDQFINHLAKDVKIIRELPHRRKQIWVPYSMKVPRKCNERCYIQRVLPNLLRRHAVQLTKYDYRLSNRLENDLQKLRCKVNYHALKFTDPILEMGHKLVQRMKLKSKHYIALHLRFEPDMLAFSGCYYGGGDKERKELAKIRKRWKTLHISNPDKMRRQGRCPLTPEELGLMLRALGYGRDIHIYVASGEVYGGEQTLAPLKALFPNFHSKDTIASKEELAPFAGFSSRLAALDFIGCDESDVFVTNNNGNMAKIIAGRRRYFGHKPTIRPNAKKLSRLLMNRHNTTWEEFASRVRTFQKGFMGEPKEIRPGRGEFHENPATCICEDSEALAKLDAGVKQKGKSPSKKDVILSKEDKNNNNDTVEDDQEWSDPDDEEDMNNPEATFLYNGTNLDYDGSSNEELEFDEMLPE